MSAGAAFLFPTAGTIEWVSPDDITVVNVSVSGAPVALTGDPDFDWVEFLTPTVEKTIYSLLFVAWSSTQPMFPFELAKSQKLFISSQGNSSLVLTYSSAEEALSQLRFPSILS